MMHQQEFAACDHLPHIIHYVMLGLSCFDCGSFNRELGD